VATVTRNDDPRGSGRIQVRMNWQADDMNTNWIRVMTPDAGRSGSSLMLNDSVGSVTLHDRGGVSMNFDGAGCSSFEARKNTVH
jgi:phage-related baseplate assembly protein